MFSRLAQRSLRTCAGRSAISLARPASSRPLTSTFHTLRRPSPLPRTPAPLNSRPQRRTVSSFAESVRRNKIVFTVFGLLAVAAVGTAAYYVYLFNELVDKPLSRYPPAVAQNAKSALYYYSKQDASNMTAHWKKAIAGAEEAGLHPLSDEVAGLKVEAASLLAKLNDGQYKAKAVDILEHVLDENAAGAEYFGKEGRWEDRSKVLKRAVMLGYKVGELYTELKRTKQAEEALVWSTETLLREAQRRAQGKDVEGEWFDHVEVAQCLEKLADHYESTSQHVLAAPLYLRAVTLMPSAKTDCHTLTLMTNLSASLSQQNLPKGAGITREQLIQDAEKWANKVIELDANVKPPERTDECDSACLVATHNLGELAEMLGKNTEAENRYTEALSLAKGLGSEEGVRRAEEGLARLAAKAAGAKK